MDFFFSLKSTFKYLQPYLNYMKDDPPTSHHSSPVGQGPFNVMRGGGSSSCLWAGLGSQQQPQTHPTGRNSAEQGAESGFPTNNIHGGAINDKDFEQLQESRALFLVCAHWEALLEQQFQVFGAIAQCLWHRDTQESSSTKFSWNKRNIFVYSSFYGVIKKI